MGSSETSPVKERTVGLDSVAEEKYNSVSKLLQEFTDISTIDKAWTFTVDNGSQCMFSVNQPSLLANKRRKFVISGHISAGSSNSVSFQWAPFPIEMIGVSMMVPSPSGSKLLVVRNPGNDSPTQFEIWSQSQVEKEYKISQSIHGSVYSDGWFEGISWSSDETLIAYVAEEPAPSKPTFSGHGYLKGVSAEKDCSSWKGQGYWEEDWGEAYAGKRQPALFVIDIKSGEVHPVDGVGRSLSVGQVVWAPSTDDLQQNLVFVGWPSDARKLGMKYCYNRPCALYAVKAPFSNSKVNQSQNDITEDAPLIKLTGSISSAFFPRFSPDGKFLAFLSAKSSVDSGHSATNSLHRIDWPADGKLSVSTKIVDVPMSGGRVRLDYERRAYRATNGLSLELVPVVMCAEDGCFPGLYCFNILSKPWLSDGHTMILTSTWHSARAILSVDLLSGNVSRVSPSNSNSSWIVLTLDCDNIVAVCSSPVDVPEIKYGHLASKASINATWSWHDVSSPMSKCSEMVRSLLSSLQFSIVEIPVRGSHEKLARGASKPFEAIFVSSKSKQQDACDPLIVMLHGGPHSTAVTSFSKSLGFLSSLGYSLLILNYRGSLGFGEEALQSLPGNIGFQDVNDVLTAIDHIIDIGLADPSKIALLGGSHGGFLAAHLIGQKPDKFAAAAVRNPVCNLALMVGTTDIPEWCYVETFGHEGMSIFMEAPSAEHLSVFYEKSPISHVNEVKTPVLFVLGAKDLRVPMSTGLQYARALKEKGVEVEILVFPDDNHALDRPRTEFESFLNIGVWFNKYCR